MGAEWRGEHELARSDGVSNHHVARAFGLALEHPPVLARAAVGVSAPPAANARAIIKPIKTFHARPFSAPISRAEYGLAVEGVSSANLEWNAGGPVEPASSRSTRPRSPA